MTQVTVFGATGRIGRLVVAALQAKGVTVVAAVHGAHDFIESDILRVVQVDVYESESVSDALEGSSVVISALGSWGTKRQDVLTAGMENIIRGMEAQSIKRIVSLTGADSRAHGDRLGFVHRAMHMALGLLAGKILRDGEMHIALLAASTLNWTVVRSPVMSDQARYGRGQLSLRRPYPWQLIYRGYVVNALVDCAGDGTSWSTQAPFIS